MEEVITKELRKLIKRRFHTQVMSTLELACIDKAMREREQGEWNFIKELRLQGVLHVCKHARQKDLTLSILAWLAFQNGLHIDFAFVPKENEKNDGKGIIFTDTGVQERR